MTNIYQDEHSGGWIVEFCYRNDHEWHRIGVFGTRTAAKAALAKAETA